ncbi:hypothetical protein KIPB_007402, partial [Kipferlia bialata]
MVPPYALTFTKVTVNKPCVPIPTVVKGGGLYSVQYSDLMQCTLSGRAANLQLKWKKIVPKYVTAVRSYIKVGDRMYVRGALYMSGGLLYTTYCCTAIDPVTGTAEDMEICLNSFFSVLPGVITEGPRAGSYMMLNDDAEGLAMVTRNAKTTRDGRKRFHSGIPRGVARALDGGNGYGSPPIACLDWARIGHDMHFIVTDRFHTSQKHIAFNMTTKTWTPALPLPFEVYNPAVMSVGPYLLVIGGTCHTGTIHALHTDTGTWEEWGPTPTPLCACLA